MKPKWNDPVLAVSSDSTRIRKYRALQSWYRETVLGIAPGMNGRGRMLGSMLPENSKPGLNFLDPVIACYAEMRIPEIQKDGGTVDVDRLRRNMLSSMPLCFNLFGYLRKHPVETARILSRVLYLSIQKISDIRIEWAPPADDHLQDRSAFDAFIEYTRRDGRMGFVGIETKYTEPFSKREYESSAYDRCVETAMDIFKSDAASRLCGSSTNQLWRSVMLGASLKSKSTDYAEFCVAVFACADDSHADAALDGVRGSLHNPVEILRDVRFEMLISECEREPALSNWAREFRKRYLDLSPVAEM